MNTTELLLAHDPRDAIIMMLNLENGTNFHVNDFIVSDPTPTEDSPNTEVQIRVRDSYGRFDELPYINDGPITFRYNRLDVGSFFNGVLGGYTTELPTSTQTLLDEITARVGQQFVLDDIVLEDISRENVNAYRLRAKAESLRWIGEMPIVVSGMLQLDDYLNELLPNALGTLSNAVRFAPANAVQPSLNATTIQRALLDSTLDQPAQNGGVLPQLLSQVLHHPTQASFRAPLYENAYFENGLVGWNTVGTVLFDAENPGRVTLQTTAPDLTRIYRNLKVTAGHLVEVTVMVGRHSQSVPREIAVELLDSQLNVLQSFAYPLDFEGNPNLLNDTGLIHLYFLSPVNTPNIAVTIYGTGTETSDQVWVQQLSCVVFPEQWLPEMQRHTTAEDGSYTLFANASDHWVALEKAATPGRSTYIRLQVQSKGAQPLGFLGTALTLQDGQFLDPASIENGDTCVVVLNNPATNATGSNSLGIYVKAGDSWVFDSLEVGTLPFAWQRDLNPLWDGYANDVLTVPPNNTSVSSAYVSTDFDAQARLTIEYSDNTSQSVDFQTLGLGLHEAFTFTLHGLRTPSSQFVEVEFDNCGTMMMVLNTPWTTGNPWRFNLYATQGPQSAYGFVDTLTSNSQPRFSLTAYDAGSGSTVTAGTTLTLYSLSVRIQQSRWYLDPSPGFYNVYGAKLTSWSQPIAVHWNRLLPDMEAASIVQLDTTHTQGYSHAPVWLPYTPYASIPSLFTRLPQLTAYGVSTTDDGTYLRDYLLPLVVGQLIDPSKLPASMDVDVFEQNPPWVVDSTLPAQKNLYNAMVQYNGLLRPNIDPPPAIQGLDRVCAFYLDANYCTNYRGIVRFYYR